MNKFSIIIDNFNQILALTEKNIKLNLRFKFGLLVTFIAPLVIIIMPLIIMGQFFNYNANFGPWTKENYLVFQLMAYNIMLLQGIVSEFPSQLKVEKYWKTLPSIIIAPFNRFNLLFGILLSRLIIISIPFTIFVIICYVYYPISIFTLLFILFLYLLIALIFSGIGLILGIYAITRESLWKFFAFIINLIMWTSCIS